MNNNENITEPDDTIDDLIIRIDQELCDHSRLYIDNHITYCEECWKALKIDNE